MVAEDRRIRLAGYEVYRFGGYELLQDDAEALVQRFSTTCSGRRWHLALRGCLPHLGAPRGCVARS
jgi:hypothetical protein